MHAKFDASTAGSFGGVKADAQNCALYIVLYILELGLLLDAQFSRILKLIQM